MSARPTFTDPTCADCVAGTCLYLVRYRVLRRALARADTRGRRGARAVTPPSEQCPCGATVPAGVSWCPECKGAIRFTLEFEDGLEWGE